MSERRLRLPLLFPLVLLSAAAATRAEDRYEWLARCASGTSHVEQRSCLEEKVKESLAGLDSAQKELMVKLRRADQKSRQKHAAIAAAQADAQGYVAYATKHCEAFASLAYGGNSQQDRRLACHIEMNLIRAAQVGKEATSLP